MKENKETKKKFERTSCIGQDFFCKDNALFAGSLS